VKGITAHQSRVDVSEGAEQTLFILCLFKIQKWGIIIPKCLQLPWWPTGRSSSSATCSCFCWSYYRLL